GQPQVRGHGDGPLALAVTGGLGRALAAPGPLGLRRPDPPDVGGQVRQAHDPRPSRRRGLRRHHDLAGPLTSPANDCQLSAVTRAGAALLRSSTRRAWASATCRGSPGSGAGARTRTVGPAPETVAASPRSRSLDTHSVVPTSAGAR